MNRGGAGGGKRARLTLLHLLLFPFELGSNIARILL